MPYYKATFEIDGIEQVAYYEAPTEERCRAGVRATGAEALSDDKIAIEEVEDPPSDISVTLA